MNIYETLKKLQNNSYIIEDETHSFIIQAFANLFNKSLNLEKTSDELSFSYFGKNSGQDISLKYHFRYGDITLYSFKETLFVSFTVYSSVIKKLNIPFETSNFVVYTDQSLNYKQAVFERHFDLRYNMKSFSILTFTHLIMPDRIENKLVSNLFYGNDLTANLTTKNQLSKKLVDHYFKMDDDFRDCITKFLILCDYKSETFTDVFSEYADLIRSINNHSDIIDILNMFEQHYVDNVDDLNDKMLVSEMSLI